MRLPNLAIGRLPQAPPDVRHGGIFASNLPSLWGHEFTCVGLPCIPGIGCGGGCGCVCQVSGQVNSITQEVDQLTIGNCFCR